MYRYIATAMLTLSACCHAAESTTPTADELFKEAELLAKQNMKVEALAKCEEAVADVDRAFGAGQKLGRAAMEGLQRAAQLTLDDFLDYEKSLVFCDKILKYGDSDYWRVPGHLQMAMTYRAMGDFEEAQKEYDAIASAEERYRSRSALPQAEMVLYDMGDKQRGRALFTEALMNDQIHPRERYGALTRCAQRALAQGRRDEAIEWYALLEKLPNENADDRTSSLARVWYEMGKIEEQRGRIEQAKQLYRKAMELEGGEMRYRARARDALEDIDYFE